MDFVGQVADQMDFAELVVVELVVVHIVVELVVVHIVVELVVVYIAVVQAVGIEHPAFGSAEEAFHLGRPLQHQVP